MVRSAQGDVQVDPTGRMPGRGAYLCRDAACWDLAGRKRALEHALKVRIPDHLVATLAAGPAALPIVEHSPRVHGALAGSPDASNDNHEGGTHGQE